MEQKLRFQSPSTDGVAHDVYNLLVEAIMINRYGLIPSGAWRKGSTLQLEWSETVKIVKRLSTSMKIEPMKLAWYIRKYKVTSINYNEFGLVRYRVGRAFGYANLNEFQQHYAIVYKSQIGEVSAYVENATTYTVKEPAPQRKTLQEILQEIENGTEG
jgi:hypothetical protein